MPIRLAEPRDATRVAAIFAPFVKATAISFAMEPPTAADFERRISATLADFPFLVLEDAEVAAYAYAHPYRTLASYRWGCETSVYVNADRHRRGYARQLYGALLEILRLQNLQKAYAAITLPNEASAALHESFGFRRFATFPAAGYKLGAWRDVGWWECPLSPGLPNPPPEVLSFAAVREKHSEALSRILRIGGHP